MAALVLAVLVAPIAALSAPQPPDDAPAESFPAARVPSSETSAPEREPEPGGGPGTRTPPMIGGGVWLAKGPGPAIGGQVENITPGPGEVVGAVHTVAAHPTNAAILYLGGANGGIWKTTNATASSPMWTPLTDLETSLSIGALEFDPTDVNHQTLVAGIGRFSSFAQLGGVRSGLLRTTDAGASWSPLGGFSGSVSPSNISGVAPRGNVIVASVNDSDAFDCADGGIWRSTDTGASFSQVSPFSAVPGPLGVAFDLASDPANPSILYTGMTFVDTPPGGACPFGCCSAFSGFFNGVYKSTDTGLTWTKVSNAAMDALIVDFLTNNIEIAADGSDVFVNIVQSGRSAGIFYSADGGSTWTAMDLPRTPEGSPAAISSVTPSAFCPGGSPVAITTTAAHGLGSGMEVELSGLIDPGPPAPHPINGVWTVTVTSTTTFTLDFSCDTTPWQPGSGTWQKVVGMNPRVKPGSQGGIHAAIRTDPTTSSTVYMGGDRQDGPFPNFLGALDFSGRLFRGDATVTATGAIPSPQWQHLTHSSAAPPSGSGTASSSAPHADAREIVFDAAGDLIEVDDGGIYRRTQPTSASGDWFSLNGNLQVTEQHDVAYDAVSNIIISGNQDTGTTQQMTPNGLIWDSVSTADGGDVAVDDSAAPSIRYSSFQNLGAFTRATYDAANTLTGFTPVALTDIGSIGGIIPNFVTPVEINAVMPTRLVLGGCNAVFESFDMGDTISEIAGPVNPECDPPVITFPQNAIAYGGFAAGVPNPDVLHVGTGPFLWGRTGGGALSFLSTYPGTVTVRDVVLDPNDWSDVYVVESNLSGGTAPFFSMVWFSSDSGATWTDITGNLTDPGLQTVEFVPGTPDRLMVGGRDGVFRLVLPAGAGPFVWGEIGTGLPNAPVWDMEYDPADDVLVVATLGRGAWVLQENGACGKVDTLVVNNQWVTATQLEEACTRIDAGPSLDVTGTGKLTLKSPTVALDNGVEVKTGGELEVQNAVP